MNDTFETAKKNIITYFKGVRTEFGKITWPEKNQVVVETFFVVAIVFIFTVSFITVSFIFYKSRPEGLEPSTSGFGDRRSTN